MPLLTYRDSAVAGRQPRQCRTPPTAGVSSSLTTPPPFPPSTPRSFGEAAPVVGLCGGEVAHRPLQDDEGRESFEAAAVRCAFPE